MLKIRVIPTLLWKHHGLVKGVGFNSWRRTGTVLPAIKVYNARDVDELILLDITATNESNEPDFSSIAEFALECFVPLTVGGGIRTVEDITNLLRSGADKISINSVAYSNPTLIEDAASSFGSQCVVASIDVRKTSDNKHECFSHCATKATGLKPSEWAKQLESLGAGEILLTSVERDGTMEGYDVDLIQEVASSVNIPVIASGGAGNSEHLYEAITKGEASAVAAASIFNFTEQTPLELKKELARKGLPMRVTCN